MESDMPQAAIMDRSPHSPPYKRHRPEQTLLYQIVEQYCPEFSDVWRHRVNPYQYIFSKNLQNISSVAGLNIVFCECNATSAIMNTWLRSVVSGAVFVQAVVQDAWRKELLCWLMRFCLNNRYANGC